MNATIPTRTRPRLGHRRRALGAAVSIALFGSSCALLVPASWRSRAPMALAGPLELPGDAAVATDPTSSEALSEAVAADRLRLSEIVSDPTRATVGGPTEAELRDIAGRLPRLQDELALRSSGESGARIRHPVIR